MESPLVNLALLETLKSERFNDEIDLFLPFIAVTIRELNMPTVGIIDIQSKLSELFGFKPPIGAIKVLMSRAKSKKLLIRENHAFIPCASKIAEWSNGYEQKKEDLELSLGSLKAALIDFTLQNFNKNISREEAGSLIFKFVEENVSATVSRRAYNKAELDDNIKNTSHIVASFISYIHKKEPLLLEHFNRCVKGMLLANYLYFADQITSKKSFEKISVYLDSPIVIGLLGFNGSFNKQANEEFIELLKGLKIQTYIFDVTLDEIERLLAAWKNDIGKGNYARFNTKTLELLRSQGYDEIRLDTEIKKLQRSIESKGITVKYGFSPKERYQCDEVGLEKAISENFRKDKDLAHDTVCISRVHNMRESRHIKDLTEQFSVFVTVNTGLAKYANGFFQKNNYRPAIPVVVSEQWMTIMFWLKKPDLASKLATDQIVATAYSLLYTDDRFWEAFLDRFEKVKRRGAITEDDFVLVRWDSDLLKIVQDTSVEVGEDFTEEDIFDIVENVKRKHFESSQKAINDLAATKDMELNDYKNESKLKLNDLMLQRQSLEDKHQNLIRKIDKFASVASWSLTIVPCTILVLLLIVAAIESLPDEVLANYPDLKNYINLGPTLKKIVFIASTIFALASSFFGLDLKKVTTFSREWISKKISRFFFN